MRHMIRLSENIGTNQSRVRHLQSRVPRIISVVHLNYHATMRTHFQNSGSANWKLETSLCGSEAKLVLSDPEIKRATSSMDGNQLRKIGQSLQYLFPFRREQCTGEDLPSLGWLVKCTVCSNISVSQPQGRSNYR